MSINNSSIAKIVPNLMFVVAVLELLKFFLYPNVFMNRNNIAIAVFNFIFFIVLGIFIKKGFSWVKYILLALTIIGVVNIISTFNYKFENSTIFGAINILQKVCLIIVTIFFYNNPLLFKKEI